ncbi:MAG: hypothetical protein KDA28_10970, partial [Phycisphaerales bacterium]|nr:hypothetical protein [Phycisphaerales bacterium]
MCTLCSIRTDTPTDFASRMVDILNHAGIVQMISVGHRTGLFDALDGDQPRTCADIASTHGFDERYVREWLGTMVTGGIVDHDPAQGTFWLPAEHADLLTRRSAHNLGLVTQFLPVLAGVEDQIVECFRQGGGVPYSAFPRFHDVMAEMSDMIVVS